jgi:hypothetical protein
MSGAAIVLCIAMAVAPSEPETLVTRLGAPRYADREAAAAALERLGRAAIPALRAARTHRDSEIRSRSETLLVKIEGSLLLEPTLVTLDFHDRPVSEVVKEINKKCGLPLLSLPDDRVAGTRHVSLETPQPVPFWSAIDRLCDAGGLQYQLASRSNMMVREPSIPLTSGESRLAGMLSDHGPFRVNLMSLHYQRDLTFGPPVGQFGQPMGMGRGGPQFGPNGVPGQLSGEQFYLRMQLAAEPQLSVTLAGAAKVTTATDDLGQSLVLAPSGATLPQINGYFGTSVGPIQFQVFLKRPERPGRSIKTLKGTLPLHVSTRKPESLTIPLDGATGKTFHNDDATLTIHESRPLPGQNQGSIELSIATKAARSGANDPDGFLMPRGMDVSQLNLELVDANGRVIPWFPSSITQNGDDVRLTLTVQNGGTVGQAAPATLRYFGTIQTSAEIPFAFKDVPMP